MSSQSKIEANRRNAERSTGPKTPEGKAASSRNAVRHGLSTTTLAVMPGENPADLEHLAQAINAEFNPGTDTERYLVDQMILARWRLARIARLEAEALDGMDDRDLLAAIEQHASIFDKLERYRAAAGRTHSKALRELAQLRANRAKSTAQNKAKQGAEWYLQQLERVRDRVPLLPWSGATPTTSPAKTPLPVAPGTTNGRAIQHGQMNA